MSAPVSHRDESTRRRHRRRVLVSAVTVCLLALAACGAEPTPPPITVPAVATQVAASPVQIISARVSGDDPMIIVKNTSTDQADISGWTLLLGPSPVILPANPSLLLYPTLTVNLHLSNGGDTSIDVYMGRPSPGVLSSLTSGDKIALVDPHGQVASVYQIP
jgi:hypothetical protein